MTASARMRPPLAVCITGMHRSGTSLVARLANLLGVDLGPEERMLGPRSDNPAGFWEHAELAEISEAVLETFGGSWHEVPRFPSGWERAPELETYKERARQIIDQTFSDSPMWGWKDPRAAVTLPFWQTVVPNLRYIICLRNPVAVVRSLMARDRFREDKSFRLWIDYTTAALQGTTDRQRLLIWFENCLESEHELKRIMAFLNREPDPQAGSSGDVDRLRNAFEAIQPDLYHHAATDDDVRRAGGAPFSAKALYFVLRANGRMDGAVGQDLLPYSVLAAREDRELREIILERNNRLRELHASLEALARDRESERASLQREVQEAGEMLHVSRTEAEKSWNDLADLRIRIASLRDSVVEGLAELERVAKVEREIRAETAACQTSLAAIRASNTWRLLERYWSIRQRGRHIYLRARGSLVLPSALTAFVRRLPRSVREQPIGVNVAGYIEAESGMGEGVRSGIRAFEAAGIPVVLNNVAGPNRAQDRTYTKFSDENPHPFNLVHLNADNAAQFARARGRRYFKGRYTIGYWAWELARFRPDWIPAFKYFDEIWCPSDFCRTSIAEHAPIPVMCWPHSIVRPNQTLASRARFGLPDSAFLFLFIFDISSQAERKNPTGLIRAFRRLNPPSGVRLVLKFTNSGYDHEAVRRLREEAEGLDVAFADGYMDRHELAGLVNVVDCYVSLHRGEGFGITLAEAMSLGKPVIATGYSGNLQYMTPENSYPVEYRLVPIDRDHGPYLRGYEWADPDLDHAAEMMRRVLDRPGEAETRGARAADDISRCLSPAIIGGLALARLQQIRRR
jgi:glycosyltransferase involved in cell wall biosynthesis